MQVEHVELGPPFRRSETGVDGLVFGAFFDRQNLPWVADHDEDNLLPLQILDDAVENILVVVEELVPKD
jgi:hypothetical protein